MFLSVLLKISVLAVFVSGLQSGRTGTLLQFIYDAMYLSQDSLLHGLFPQTKVSQGHQTKASLLSPARAIICQNHSGSMSYRQKGQFRTYVVEGKVHSLSNMFLNRMNIVSLTSFNVHVSDINCLDISSSNTIIIY